MNPRSWSIGELVTEVNDWCAARGIEPLNNGAGGEVTVRNLRYYQSIGLVDRPPAGRRAGYSGKHRLQLIAIRSLQARGWPLARIKGHVAGRSEEELARFESADGGESAPTPLTRSGLSARDWIVTPLGDDVLLLTRGGRALTAAQRTRILDLLRPSTIPEPAEFGVGGFSPETD